MDGLVSRASMIRLSLHPLPASETSAFNKIRALSTRRAGLFPFRISVSSRSRSSPLSLTTYFFTEISFAAMIAAQTAEKMARELNEIQYEARADKAHAAAVAAVLGKAKVLNIVDCPNTQQIDFKQARSMTDVGR